MENNRPYYMDNYESFMEDAKNATGPGQMKLHPYSRSWHFKIQYSNPLNYCAFPFSYCLNTEWYQFNLFCFTLEIEKY